MKPAFRAITFCMRCGICWQCIFWLFLEVQVYYAIHALIIFSIKSLLLVIILSSQISFFRAAHTFLIGLRPGELPDQSKRAIKLDFLKSLNKIKLLDKNHLNIIIWLPTVNSHLVSCDLSLLFEKSLAQT